MERHTFAMEIKKGQMNSYRKNLGGIWPELTAFLDRHDVRNFSIWSCSSLIFGYCETDTKKDLYAMATEQIPALIGRMEDTFTWISTPGQNMRLMYHNYGIIRENKEMIRHRVFMTKLKPGCEEEYKARHDALIAARGDTPDPGPDSNFSIWNAGGYIFGYNEIDTSMEVEETPEAHAASVAWESRQLEIMDWITNDMDWLTKSYHPASVRLAWHEGR
ncbi:MAG: L-rhamnose mutarotase [Lachnospiraceae bacterium]|jgi:L-rhamnose mutarotase|nr:L-rhamnose mutarotase [Lachnospiraceae bacterium]